MRRAAAAFGVSLAVASSAAAQGAFHVESTPPTCFVPEKAPVLIACLTPRTVRGDVRVLFRADDGPWYAAPMRHEMPCYRGLLPRPTAGTPSVTYVVEAHRAGVIARSAEHVVPVQDACAGAAPVTTQRATWDAPSGAPKTPAGFEGARAREGGPSTRTADAPASRPSPAARTPQAKTPARSEPAAPPPRPAPAPAPAKASVAKPSGGGHGLRNAAIILGGAAAAGGGVVVARSAGGDSTPPTTTGTGLPAGGVGGTYVGTESVVYSPSCTGTDDVVLNLQQSGSAVSGVLTFTVRTCACCAAGRGAAPISGFLSDTRLDFSTPIGFGYSGTFAGSRLSGSLSGPGGVSGTWTVDKR